MKNKKLTIKLPGAINHFSDYKSFFSSLDGIKLLRKNNVQVYDSPSFKWNGGRLNRPKFSSSSSLFKIIEIYNKLGIQFFFSFTNHTIDINNKYGNTLLNKLTKLSEKYNIKNGIIINNENFNAYLLNNYPLLSRTCSIISHDFDITLIDEYIEHYKKLEKKYDRIVIRSEHSLDKKIINNINIDKYEILFNDNCVYNCPIWKEHFLNISNTNLDINFEKISNEEFQLFRSNIEECPLKKGENSFNNEEYKSLDRSNDYDFFSFLIKEGYVHFKFAGRTSEFKDLKYKITQFLHFIDR